LTPLGSRDLLTLRNLAAERIRGLPGVIGVGIGPNVIGGEGTGTPALKVLVDRKLPPHLLPMDGFSLIVRLRRALQSE